LWGYFVFIRKSLEYEVVSQSLIFNRKIDVVVVVVDMYNTILQVFNQVILLNPLHLLNKISKLLLKIILFILHNSHKQYIYNSLRAKKLFLIEILCRIVLEQRKKIDEKSLQFVIVATKFHNEHWLLRGRWIWF